MPARPPAFRPRPMGGFNPGMGAVNEHLDENAMQAAAKQKVLAQQTTSSAQPAAGGNALGSASPSGQAGGMPGMPGAQPPGVPPAPPREVGSIAEELIKRPAQDIQKELGAFFDLNALLGINPQVDDAQTQARKKQMLQRWNKLNDEQQAIARQKYQEDMKKKQQEEQEKQAKKQQQEQAQAQSLNMPSSPQRGAEGPGGSGKKRATQKLQNDRKTLSGPSSAN